MKLNRKALVRSIRAVDAVWWFLLAFFLMCCAYEMGRVLHLRPQPHHLWRQADCLALTWNYYEHTWNLFQPAMHAQLGDGLTSGRTAGEFPLLYYVVGMIWRVTGPSEFLYRVVGLLLHFSGSLALFASLRRVLGSAFWSGVVTLLLFTSPVILYFGVAFLPDVPALDLALIGWWFLVRYSSSRERRHLVWSAFFFTLAMLLKVTAGMSLLAIMGVLAVESFRGRLRWYLFPDKGFAWTVFGLGLVTVYAWYAYAAAYNDAHGFKYTFNNIWPIWEMTPKAREWAWEMARGIIVFQVFDTSAWLFFGVALVVLLVNARTVPGRLWLLLNLLLLGSVAYTLLWFAALDGHDYYFINPMIAFLVLAAAFLWWLGRRHPDILSARWSRWSMVVLLLFNTAYAANNLRMRYDESGRMSSRNLPPFYHEAELRFWNELGWWDMNDLYVIEPYLQSIGVLKEDRVLFCDDGSFNGALVLMGRKGWTAFGWQWQKQGAVEQMLEHDLKYIILTSSKWLQVDVMRPYLINKIGHVGNVRIYDVRDLRVESTVLLNSGASSRAAVSARLDTVSCTRGPVGWCFNNNEIPLEMDSLLLGAGEALATDLIVEGIVPSTELGVSGLYGVLEERDQAEYARYRACALPPGPFHLRFALPQRTHGVRHRFYLLNRGRSPFRLDRFNVRLVRSHKL